jgi:hypothetical protein
MCHHWQHLPTCPGLRWDQVQNRINCPTCQSLHNRCAGHHGHTWYPLRNYTGCQITQQPILQQHTPLNPFLGNTHDDDALGMANSCSSCARLGWYAGDLQLCITTTTTASRLAASAAYVGPVGTGSAGVRGATCTCSGSGWRQSQSVVQAGQQEG